MTVADVMDLTVDATGTEEMARELATMNATLSRLADAVDGLVRRVERLEELPADLWPAVEGASHALTATLAELDADGTLAAGGTLLGTLRTLARPEVAALLDGAARGLREGALRPDDRPGLVGGLRDADVRRGLGLVLSVVREVGRTPPTPITPTPALPAGSLQGRTP